MVGDVCQLGTVHRLGGDGVCIPGAHQVIGPWVGAAHHHLAGDIVLGLQGHSSGQVALDGALVAEGGRFGVLRADQEMHARPASLGGQDADHFSDHSVLGKLLDFVDHHDDAGGLLTALVSSAHLRYRP